jgi:hypothetical protein
MLEEFYKKETREVVFEMNTSIFTKILNIQNYDFYG